MPTAGSPHGGWSSSATGPWPARWPSRAWSRCCSPTPPPAGALANTRHSDALPALKLPALAFPRYQDAAERTPARTARPAADRAKRRAAHRATTPAAAHPSTRSTATTQRRRTAAPGTSTAPSTAGPSTASTAAPPTAAGAPVPVPVITNAYDVGPQQSAGATDDPFAGTPPVEDSIGTVDVMGTDDNTVGHSQSDPTGPLAPIAPPAVVSTPTVPSGSADDTGDGHAAGGQGNGSGLPPA